MQLQGLAPLADDFLAFKNFDGGGFRALSGSFENRAQCGLLPFFQEYGRAKRRRFTNEGSEKCI